MGQLAGFSYREAVKLLKAQGLEFHRQAAGSHEIWFNPALKRYTTIPNHPGDIVGPAKFTRHSGTPNGGAKNRVFASRLLCSQSLMRTIHACP
ncbi:MAG: type II toxin-antitoxin system HicA family toxin [Polaromonas sp.]